MRRPSLRLALFAGAAVVYTTVCLVAVPALANHGSMPRIHWESGYRQGIKVYNRAGAPYVAQSIADWNAAAGGLVSYDPNVITGGDPGDCSAPPFGAIALCRVNGGNPYALYAGMDHLAWCVVGLAWDDLPTEEHEMGHCLGLGHHGDGVHGPFGGWDGGIMGGEGKITQVDHDALVNVYSHDDGGTPPAPPVMSAPPASQPVALASATPVPSATPAPAATPPPTVAPAAPNGGLGWGYSCLDAANVTATTADLGGTTNDAGATAVTVTVTRSGAVVGAYATTFPYRVTVTGLAPSTTYAYTATFNPGAHPQQGQPCTFTTAAAPSAPAVTTPPASTSTPPAPPAAAATPPAPTCTVMVFGLCLR